ncbi:hypothetical protein MZM54_29415 [[Brevibacterium] frigoritolerans]|nr:hypothetical protein [Peribacillus frigoritolerans]
MNRIQDSHQGHQVRHIQVFGWLIGMVTNWVHSGGGHIFACLGFNQTGFLYERKSNGKNGIEYKEG